MSRYDDLYRAFLESEKRFQELGLQVCGFAGFFIKGLVEFLECPDENLRFIPIEGDIDPGRTYTLQGAMRQGQDGFWSFGVDLTLKPPLNPDPRVRQVSVYCTVSLHFRIRRENEGFVVKFGRKSEWTVNPEIGDDVSHIHRAIFDAIKEDFETEVEKYLPPESPRRIGF